MSTAVARSRPVRVVIVDDTADLRELLRLALTRGGMEVVGEAGDGRAGIEVVRAEQPDLVLLDLSMPVMDGLEALPSMRRLVPAAKIVVLSGFGATQMSERALAGGADGYLQKGMPLPRILDHLRTILDPVDEPVPVPASPPALSLVPAPAADPEPPTRAYPAVVETPTQPDAAARDALALAPYGVLEVADEPLLRVVHANPVAQRLLGGHARCGVPLGTMAPLLTSLVARHRLDGDAAFVVDVGGAGVRATLRRRDGSLLIYFDPTADPTADDVGVLRRAIATTAHEIRGPVAVLCGVAEAITSEDDPAARNRMLASVARQARVLDGITADLLTAAEVQRGALRLDLQPVHPAEVAAAVLADRHLVTVTTVVEDHRPVLADPRRLEQVLGNLVANALKYGRAPYAVGVRTDPADPARVVVEVSDAGEGVPAGFRGSLFCEYTRAGAGGTVATGVGLGLYVVRSLVEAQGGTVGYTDVPTGGACFTLSLPAV